MTAERVPLTPHRLAHAPARGAALPSLYHVSAVTVLGAIFVVGLAPRLDTDLWWHLLAGSYVMLHHAVPTTDPYSFTMNGHAWTDHEWLTQTLMYLIDRVSGVWGVTLFFAGVVTAAFTLVYLRMCDLRINRLGAAFLLLAGFGAASPILGARPQMVTLLFMAAYALVATRVLRSGDRRLLVIFPALMVLWVNMHGGFSLGLLYLAVVIAGEAANVVTRGRTGRDWSRVRALGAALAACIAVALINPYGWHLLLYPFQLITPNTFTNSLNEWSSPDFHMPQMMLFEALFLLMLAAIFIARKGMSWTDVALIVVMTNLALSGARNVAVWVVLITPILGTTLQEALHRLRAANPRVAAPRRRLGGRAAGALNLALLGTVLVLYAVEAGHYTGPAALADSERQTFPTAAVAYIESNRLPRRVFAPYAWGGYLIWKLPGYQDFIDGRANTLFDAATLRAYLHAYSAAPAWRSILDQNRVQTVLEVPGAPLAQALAADARWRQVFRDAASVVYIRR